MLDFLGTPLVALLIAVIVAMFTLGRGAGMGTEGDRESLETVAAADRRASCSSSPPAAASSRPWSTPASATSSPTGSEDSGISVLLLAWLVAVLIRLATGSATVATVTASGHPGPAGRRPRAPTETSLLVLAIGAGSLFFSHVNDAGFWLVKEYFGLTVGQTIKTWSVMETIISVTGLVLVLVLDVFV